MSSFQSLSVLISRIGTKQSFKLILKYPEILLTPVFSCWTFDISKNKPPNHLEVSIRMTWINILITSVGIFGLMFIHFSTKEILQETEEGFDLTQNLIFHINSCFFLGLSWLTLIILQQLPECKDTCCKCCQENCFPVLEKTALDIDCAFSNQNDGLELVEIFEDMTSIRTKLRNVVNGSVYLG